MHTAKLTFVLFVNYFFLVGNLLHPVNATAADQKLSGLTIPINDSQLTIHPVHHSSFVLQWNGATIYVDPVGGGDLYSDLPFPDIILITDDKPEHFDIPTLRALVDPHRPNRIVAPKSARKKYPREDMTLRLRTTTKKNKENGELEGILIVALPTHGPEAGQEWNEVKNIGNGYLLWLAKQGRVYISGNLESVPHPLFLSEIDVAFFGMNQAYSSNMDAAAKAIESFSPKIVVPYHYYGQKPSGDLPQLPKLLDKTKVHLLDWHHKKAQTTKEPLENFVLGTWNYDIEHMVRSRYTLQTEEQVLERVKTMREQGVGITLTFNVRNKVTIKIGKPGDEHDKQIEAKWKVNHRKQVVQVMGKTPRGRTETIEVAMVNNNRLQILPITEFAGFYERAKTKDTTAEEHN